MAGDDQIRLAPDDRNRCVSELLLVDHKLHLNPEGMQNIIIASPTLNEQFGCEL